MSPKEQYREYYQEMFRAEQCGDKKSANEFRILMEKLRQSHISSSHLLPLEVDQLPHFVQSTLNKSQIDLGFQDASNCINAALNFHSSQPVYAPYSAMDFLEVIRSHDLQLESKNQLLAGDLVVFWSRFNDDWADRKILVKDLSPHAPGFPFGLVFDHVAVFVGQNNLYHKPDPTPESRYQINTWDDVVGFSQVINGFELTFHRKIL